MPLTGSGAKASKAATSDLFALASITEDRCKRPGTQSVLGVTGREPERCVERKFGRGCVARPESKRAAPVLSTRRSYREVRHCHLVRTAFSARELQFDSAGPVVWSKQRQSSRTASRQWPDVMVTVRFKIGEHLSCLGRPPEIGQHGPRRCSPVVQEATAAPAAATMVTSIE